MDYLCTLWVIKVLFLVRITRVYVMQDAIGGGRNGRWEIKNKDLVDESKIGEIA